MQKVFNSLLLRTKSLFNIKSRHGFSEQMLKCIFLLIDKNDNGVLDIEELGIFLNDNGQLSTEKELKFLVKELD